jgi:hypothetical protein
VALRNAVRQYPKVEQTRNPKRSCRQDRPQDCSCSDLRTAVVNLSDHIESRRTSYVEIMRKLSLTHDSDKQRELSKELESENDRIARDYQGHDKNLTSGYLAEMLKRVGSHARNESVLYDNARGSADLHDIAFDLRRLASLLPCQAIEQITAPDPDARGYLRTAYTGVRLDTPEFPSFVYVTVLTGNIGKLQILPKATTLYYVRIRPEMTAAEEDILFSTINVGGGLAIPVTNDSFWDHGQEKMVEVKGVVQFTDGPSGLMQAANDLRDGTSKVYLFARHLFSDKMGTVTTESCFFLSGPDFKMPNDCHGHNGPAEWPISRKIQLPVER